MKAGDAALAVVAAPAQRTRARRWASRLPHVTVHPSVSSFLQVSYRRASIGYCSSLGVAPAASSARCPERMPSIP